MTEPTQQTSATSGDEMALLKAELERFRERVRAAAAEAGLSAGVLAARGHAAAAASDGYVRRAPFASAAIAFLAGCLVGRFTR